MINLLLLLAIASSIFAYNVQVTGKLTDAAGTPINGTACLSLRTNGVDTSSEWALSPLPICFPLTNGTFPASATITPNDVIQPSNTYYRFKANDVSGVEVYSANYYITSGKPFNIATAVPSNVPTSNISFAPPPGASGKDVWTGNNTSANINAIQFVDGITNITVQTAINKLPATGGTVYIQPGKYVGPTSIPSNVSLISLAPAESSVVAGAVGATVTNFNTQVVLTYSSTLNLTGMQNSKFVGIVFNFQFSGGGMQLTSAMFNQFSYISLVNCGDVGVPCLNMTTAGSGPAADCAWNTFDHLRIAANKDGTSAHAAVGIKMGAMSSASTPYVTQNKFHDTLITGTLQGGVDVESNSDTNFFLNGLALNQGLPAYPANSYFLAFNLNTPGSDQDSDGNYFDGLNGTGPAPTSDIRAGATTGNYLNILAGANSNPSIVSTGGTQSITYLTSGLPGVVSKFSSPQIIFGQGILVGSLPSATSNPGMAIYVTDSTAIRAEGQACVGGSGNRALAFSNGTIWKCF
jgi:hypothetical protein